MEHKTQEVSKMIDERREIYIFKCPFCGGVQFASGYQSGYAAISLKGNA